MFSFSNIEKDSGKFTILLIGVEYFFMIYISYLLQWKCDESNSSLFVGSYCEMSKESNGRKTSL